MKNDIKYFEVTPHNPKLDSVPDSYKETGLITSVELAEMAGKQHFHVLRDIDAMIEGIPADVSTELGIEHTTYADVRGRERPMLILTEEAALWAMSKWDDVLRAKLVLAFCAYRREELARKQRALDAHRNRADDVEDALLLVSTFDKHSANRGNQVLRAKQHEIRERRRWAEDGC